MEYQRILQIIEQYPIITIFRHQRPDCDALGSQFGLKTIIEENYPDKQVYAVGFQTNQQGHFGILQQVNDQVIEESLAIICDTGNSERIDDERWAKAKYTVKIDHHPAIEPYAKENFVDERAAATSQIITYFAMVNELSVSTKAANYLYQGLLTDTLCYRTSNTTSQSLEAGMFLSIKGIDIPKINRELFDNSLEVFQFRTYLRTQLKIEKQFGMIYLSQKDLERFHITASEARNQISEIGSIKELTIWAIFTENPEGTIDGSLRSKTITINDIAQRYHGGGHKNASGIKSLSLQEYHQIQQELIQKSQCNE